jgi:acetate kinase
MSNVVLVLNAGSSSLKYSLVDAETGRSTANGVVERIGESSGILTHRGPDGHHETEQVVDSHEKALAAVVEAFATHGPDLAEVGLVAVGHRVVHGGDRFSEPALVDDDLVAEVRELVPLAPLHNPGNLEGIEVARRLLPDVPQVAVFDTAFHQTLPEHAYTYAVPLTWRDEHRVRRYGFHGTSHAYVTGEAARVLGRRPEGVNLIVLHLGNGCSATAVAAGRSIDTSMGLTPLEGLVMGSRSGDVDPALHAHLHRQEGWSLEQIDEVLNKKSGLLGLAGENDFRELRRLVESGDEHARLAFDIYCYRVRKYVGAYTAVLGRVDAVVFTAGVGQHSPAVRAASLSDLEMLGIELDPAANDRASGEEAAVVSAPGSRVGVLVVPTNEEGEIARQALALVRAVESG